MGRPSNVVHKNFLNHPRLVDRVVVLIKSSGLSQSQMIERWGVGKSFLTDLNSGRANPSCDSMQRIYEDLTGQPLLPE